MKSPFKFLDSYTKDDREIFFGREREIEELYHRVFESKILLVYGVSGTGKSSLIHCGLANKFHETDWLPLVVRRGGNILDSLASAIKAALITQQTGDIVTPVQFKKSVRSLYLDHYKPIFFIFDQFEELFIFGNKEEKKSVVQVIKALVESEIQCRFIFVMREEYMAGITEFEKYIPTIFANRVRIEKMAHTNALEAIKGPCKVFNISLEDQFAEALLGKLSPESADVELTYLQVFLDRILRLASGNYPLPRGGQRGVDYSSPEVLQGRQGGVEPPSQGGKEVGLLFTISHLSQVGNVSDLLGSFLEEQVSLLPDPDIAMSVLKAFVSGKGTKRPANETEAIDNVCSLGKEISPEMVTELLQTFVKLRVLRDKDDHGRYELRHDALAEKIYEKFSLAEKELLEIKQFIENAYQSFNKRKILLTNEDLLYISNKDSLINLNPDLKAFLTESRKHQLDKIITVRRLTAISAFVFILLIAILGYYVMNNLKINGSNNLAILSIDQIADPVESFMLAKKAWGVNPGVLAKKAVINSFNRILNIQEKDSVLRTMTTSFEIIFEPVTVDIQFAGSSKNSKYVFGYGDSLLFIWNMKGKLEKILKTEHFPIIDMKLSDNGEYIGTVSSDSLLTIWSAAGNCLFSQKVRYNRLNTKQIFKFTQDNLIVAITKEHDAVMFGLDGKVLQQFEKHKGSVNAIDISGDDKFIATASSDKTVNIWYFNTVKRKYDFYNNLAWHKDTVWSVSFSGVNYNIISSSADSTAKIGNINNHRRHTMSGNNPICFAQFTPADWGYIATDYSRKDANITFKFYAEDFRNNNPVGAAIRNKFAISKSVNIYSGSLTSFSYLVFSNEDDYFICSDKNDYLLIDNRLAFEYEKRYNIILLQLKGEKPFFTTDGKYLVSIDGKYLRNYFINVDDIANLMTIGNAE